MSIFNSIQQIFIKPLRQACLGQGIEKERREGVRKEGREGGRKKRQ